MGIKSYSNQNLQYALKDLDLVSFLLPIAREACYTRLYLSTFISSFQNSKCQALKQHHKKETLQNVTYQHALVKTIITVPNIQRDCKPETLFLGSVA